MGRINRKERRGRKPENDWERFLLRRRSHCRFTAADRLLIRKIPFALFAFFAVKFRSESMLLCFVVGFFTGK
jgi:hypothetical protein